MLHFPDSFSHRPPSLAVPLRSPSEENEPRSGLFRFGRSSREKRRFSVPAARLSEPFRITEIFP